MSFSYFANLTDDVHKVRFEINDTVPDLGPLPLAKNFEDEEIQNLIDQEGSWQRAVAHAFERLSQAWRLYPNIESDQFGLSRSHISRGYAEDAVRWREAWGFSATATQTEGVRTISWTRVDAYSDDLTISGED